MTSCPTEELAEGYLRLGGEAAGIAARASAAQSASGSAVAVSAASRRRRLDTVAGETDRSPGATAAGSRRRDRRQNGRARPIRATALPAIAARRAPP